MERPDKIPGAKLEAAQDSRFILRRSAAKRGSVRSGSKMGLVLMGVMIGVTIINGVVQASEHLIDLAKAEVDRGKAGRRYIQVGRRVIKAGQHRTGTVMISASSQGHAEVSQNERRVARKFRRSA